MLGVALLATHLVPQSHNGWVHPQLQYRVHLTASVFFYFQKAVDIPWVQHQRLFTDGVGTRTQRKSHVRVVQVVRRAYCDVVNSLITAAAMQLVDVAVEALVFSEKLRLVKVTINDANGVVWIQRSNQVVASGFDRLHMSRCDVTGRTDQGEVLHRYRVLRFQNKK